MAQGMLPWVQKHIRWAANNFWPVQKPTTGGDVHPAGALPGVVSMLPHRVTEYRRPAFWNPTMHYKRQEYMVSPPNYPGTAIPYTLFHPTYIPGLQGYSEVLPYNFAWKWGKNNFAKFNSVGYLAKHPVQDQNAFNPAMKFPKGPGTGKVWNQPRPYYVPDIVNPGMGGPR